MRPPAYIYAATERRHLSYTYLTTCLNFAKRNVYPVLCSLIKPVADHQVQKITILIHSLGSFEPVISPDLHMRLYPLDKTLSGSHGGDLFRQL